MKYALLLLMFCGCACASTQNTRTANENRSRVMELQVQALDRGDTATLRLLDEAAAQIDSWQYEK